MIRVLRVVRATAIKARTQTVNAMKALLVTAPQDLREQLRGCSTTQLVRTCVRLPPGELAHPTAATKPALRSLAGRYEALEAEIKALDAHLESLIAETAETTIYRVIAELAVELDRIFARRDALAAEIEEAFLAHLFELLSSMPWDRSPDRIADPGRDRRRNTLRRRRQTGLLPRAGPGDTPVRQIDQRRVEEQKRKSPTQDRHVPRLLRLAARPRVQKRSTTASEPKANPTTPRSSAWPADAATSSWPCSAPNSPISPGRPLPDIAQAA